MHFQISVIDDLSNSGTPEEMVAIDAFNDELRANGHWVYANGMAAPETATVIDNRSGANVISKGPLFPAKENFSGLWIIDAPSKEVAFALAVEGSRACNRKVELRPFHH
jgi:hypothetical protein